MSALFILLRYVLVAVVGIGILAVIFFLVRKRKTPT